VNSTKVTAGKLRHVGRWWILAVALVLAGTACLVVGLRGSQHALPGPIASRVTVPAPVRSTAPKVVPLQTTHSVPVELRIPALSLSVSLSSLGLNPDGTVQVPTDVEQPGWFRLGPTPGQIGSAVILGHVDSTKGPAVFFGLRTLVPGDQVTVSLADGVTAEFGVTSVAMYSKSAFPDQLVYGSHGSGALQLVTCGGIFDDQTGHYLSNIVVYTSLDGIVPAAPLTASGIAH